jgi:hypothetical protein
MTAAPYHQKLARTLDRMGGLYAVSDILERIADGRMQSFVEGNSWAITQISVYPRGRTLDLLFTIGDIKDYRALNEKILAFAEKMDIGLVTTIGRRGWLPYARECGWKVKTSSYVYYKDM